MQQQRALHQTRPATSAHACQVRSNTRSLDGSHSAYIFGQLVQRLAVLSCTVRSIASWLSEPQQQLLLLAPVDENVRLCTHLFVCMCAGGEMPAASAAVIYFIRTAVISRLAEPGQRQLLSALATAASHAIAPPVIVAAMEGCGVLLELLGESVAAM